MQKNIAIKHRLPYDTELVDYGLRRLNSEEPGKKELIRARGAALCGSMFLLRVCDLAYLERRDAPYGESQGLRYVRILFGNRKRAEEIKARL